MPLDNVIFPGKSKVVTFFHIENFYIIMSYCFHFAQTLLLFLLYFLLGLIQLCHNKKEFLSFYLLSTLHRLQRIHGRNFLQLLSNSVS